jgi:hypothetical protein
MTDHFTFLVSVAEAAEVLPLLRRHAELLDEMRNHQILHCEPGDSAWEQTGERLRNTNRMILELSRCFTMS